MGARKREAAGWGTAAAGCSRAGDAPAAAAASRAAWTQAPPDPCSQASCPLGRTQAHAPHRQARCKIAGSGRRAPPTPPGAGSRARLRAQRVGSQARSISRPPVATRAIPQRVCRPHICVTHPSTQQDPARSARAPQHPPWCSALTSRNCSACTLLNSGSRANSRFAPTYSAPACCVEGGAWEGSEGAALRRRACCQQCSAVAVAVVSSPRVRTRSAQADGADVERGDGGPRQLSGGRDQLLQQLLLPQPVLRHQRLHLVRRQAHLAAEDAGRERGPRRLPTARQVNKQRALLPRAPPQLPRALL